MHVPFAIPPLSHTLWSSHCGCLTLLDVACLEGGASCTWSDEEARLRGATNSTQSERAERRELLGRLLGVGFAGVGVGFVGGRVGLMGVDVAFDWVRGVDVGLGGLEGDLGGLEWVVVFWVVGDGCVMCCCLDWRSGEYFDDAFDEGA